ncbi:MAG: glycosyltransferase family 4 protein [Burkholderiales bacterium]
MKTATARADVAPSALRVLVVNSVLTGGGVDSHTLSLCQALAQRGLAVSLAMPAGSRWLSAARAIEGLTVVVLDAKRFLWPFLLAGAVRRTGIQVVHAHHGRDYWVAIAAAWLARTGACAVVTRHLMTALKDKTRRYLAPNATVVAVSDAVAASLAASDPRHTLRVRRVRCGIDTQAFSPASDGGAAARQQFGLSPSAVVFAVVGAIHPPEGKGQLQFVAAAARVLRQHPDAYFLCAGSGELVPAVEQEAQRLGLAGRFAVWPFGTDMPSLMQAIDVLVHPAVGSEALGLVILEALSCGKPVIASRLDGIPETFIDGEHGTLVSPRDVDALAQAMSQMAADAGARQAMGRAGRGWVETHFSLARLGVETETVYQECLAHPL